MNARDEKIAPSDLDQLADQLASHDGSGAAPPDSTLKELKAELDTLAVQVAQPAPADEFGGESALERGLEFVKEIGRELSATGTTGVFSNEPPTEDLGMIREYRLLAKLGEGGMGAVYKALHTKLNKAVALKILPSDRLQNESAVSRFEREMRAVGKLEHPNIVRATDAGEVDGKHYLVMELVNGIDLSNLVRKVGQASSLPSDASTDQPQAGSLRHEDPQAGSLRHGAMTIADACEMIRQAAIGLQEAHEDGMVHRDIKPSNLMLARSRKGRKPPLVKILDMGLALLDDHRGERRDLTSTGQMMGTLDYMAPEQGMDSHEVDIRADIYSLGATLHKLLTGQAPFPSDKYDNAVKMMVALATKQAPSIATVRDDLPPELAAIVDRMLARNPDERFAEPEEVAEALLPFCEGCDLAGLLESATAEDAESADDESKVATHDSLKSSSVETAPTIEIRDGADGECATGPASEELCQPEQALAKPAKPVAHGDDPVDSLASTLDVKSPTANPANSPSPHRPLSRSPRLLLTAAALAGFVLLSAIIFYIKTNHGTIVVEIDDPSISVTVQGEDIRITKNDSGEAYQIKPGEHTLHVKHGDLEFDTDKFKLRRGEKVVLSVRLAEGEVRVVQKDEEQTIIGSRPLPLTPKPSTPSTTPTFASNYALAFDGNTTYVSIPTLKFDGTHPITIEAKVHLLYHFRGDAQSVITNLDSSGLGICISQRGPPEFVFSEASHYLYLTGESLPPSRRVHLTGVFDGATIRFFVDGRQTANSAVTVKTAHTPSSLEFLIGANPETHGAKELFCGTIDEVRISNVARYEKDFTPAERFEPDEHTLALYHFDEGQGEIAYDSSPNKHHGKIVGAKWVSDDLPKDPDGRVAFWALNSGGTIEVETADGNKSVKSLDKLPKEHFDFLKIDLASVSFPVTDRQLDALGFQRLDQLKELNLSGSEVTDASLVHLRDMKALRVLNLTECPIGDYGLRYLPKSLTGLTLTGTEITDFAARWLRLLTQLEYLDVKGTHLSAEFVAKLKLVLPTCAIASDYSRRQIDELVRDLKTANTDDENLVAIKPLPTPEIKPGDPLASWALVKNPTQLEGIKSWTIETRGTRSRLDRQVLFSGDGKLLAVGDWAVKFWQSHERRFEYAIVNSHLFDSHTLETSTSQGAPLYYITWSPDSSKMAIGASVWDVAKRRRIGVLVAPGQHGTEIQSADWSPDGKLLATCDNQGWVVIWDLERSQTVDKFSVADASFSMVRWSYDGKYLAAADRTDVRTPVIIWEVETGERVDVPHIPARWIEWSPVANELAVEETPFLRLFDLATRKTLWSAESQDTAPIPAWSPDGAYLLTRAGTVLNAKTGREIRKLDTKSTPGHFSWSPDGMLIAIGEINGELEFFRGTSPIPFDAINGVLNESGYVVRWSRDGTGIAATGINVSGLTSAQIPVWSSDTNTVAVKGSPNNRISIASSHTEGWKSITFENGVNIQSRAVSPDGQHVVVAGQSQSKALVWEVEGKKIVHELSDKGEVRLVAWSPAGNLIAAVSYSSPTWLVSLWDSETAERL